MPVYSSRIAISDLKSLLPFPDYFSDAYYCKECTVLEKDRDGCPKIVNLGSARTDLFYERKKYGLKAG
jgi:hypothetical protein